MKAIKILTDEHKNILKAIKLISDECDKINAGKKIDKVFFNRAISFIRNYADKLHHAKEEDILFKELCKDTTELHCNPIEQMLYEHQLGRSFVVGIENGLKQNSVDLIIENSAKYCQLLQEHIFKEDNILYPMADEILTKKTKDDLFKKFTAIDKKKESIIKKELEFLKNNLDGEKINNDRKI